MPDPVRRIAHVLPSTTVIGGTEHATLRIARAVAPAGLESVAFCLAGDTPVRRFFAREGLPVTEFPGVEPSIRRPLPYLRASRALAREFRRQRIDVVHCADVGAAHFTALAGRFAGVPVVSHVRNRHDQISRRDQVFLRPVNRWVFVSQDTWRRFAYPVAPRDGTVVYDGIDAPALHTSEARAVREEFGIAPEAPVVGMVARVSPQKDFVTLARAARRVLARHPGARFLVVGDYETEPAYREHHARVRQELDAQQVSDAFVFTGFRRDVPRVAAAMDVFALCTHFEGLPLVLLEGMAQARPIVATDVDGISELVRDGETGLLHRHEDADDLARQLTRLLDDPALAARLGAAGRHAVDTFWTNERFARDMVALYHDVLGVRPAAPAASPAASAREAVRVG
jgi:glycosyltransferase involved in cell wall biosynthesis